MEGNASILSYDSYGNPSSLYSVGLEAKAGLDKARGQVADLINAEPREITFTSCGTEADNWVLEGVADKLKDKGKHIITSRIEHHAILHTCEYLEKHGLRGDVSGCGRRRLRETALRRWRKPSEMIRSLSVS